jgi:hypothetical protein
MKDKNFIANLLTLIGKLFKALVQFLIFAALGLIAAVLLALPWLLRLVSLGAWLAALYAGIQSIQGIYAPFSSAIPLFSLQFALTLVAVAWMMILFINNHKHFWGGLLAGGIVMGSGAQGINWLAENWKYADLVFFALPPTLWALLLIYIMPHLKRKRQSAAKGGAAIPA